MSTKTIPYLSPPTLGAESLFDKVVRNSEEANTIVLCGGADICPSYYDKGNVDYSHYSHARDRREWMLMDRYCKDKKFIGICRGMQFIGVYFGGAKLHKHIDGHIGSPHAIHVPDGTVIGNVCSHHHQSINTETWTDVHGCTLHHLARAKDGTLEIALVNMHGKPKALCFQSHPEFGHNHTTHLFNQLLPLFESDCSSPAKYIEALKEASR